MLAALNVKAQALAVIQALEARALHVGNVDENVSGAVLGLDEAVALGCVEPLNSAGRHAGNPIMQGCRPTPSRDGPICL